MLKSVLFILYKSKVKLNRSSYQKMLNANYKSILSVVRTVSPTRQDMIQALTRNRPFRSEINAEMRRLIFLGENIISHFYSVVTLKFPLS